MKRKLPSEAALQPAVQQPTEKILPPVVTKQLRSKLHRRRRSRITPIILCSLSNIAGSSHLISELSRESSKSSVNKETAVKKRRSTDAEVELSECSCVESSEISSFQTISSKITKTDQNSVHISHDIVSKQKRNVKDIEETEDSNEASGDFCSKSSKNAEKIKDDDVVSFNSVLQSPSESKSGKLSVQTTKCSENRATEDVKYSEVSRVCPEVESAIGHAHEKLVGADFDLECSEHLSNSDISDDYSSSTYSELQSEIFPESSDIDLIADYSSSDWYDSGSQFSEKSNADASPSPTFALYLQFSQQFCRSSTVSLQSTSVNSPDDYHIFTELIGLEEEEDEESYRMIRKRERRQLYPHDYAEEYCSTTDYGDLIVQQRLQMVRWILEQATRKKLQKETMFLSVNLFDRFLSKGYFKTKRCLQIAGVACLTLAVRIEENQPYNSIRQKTFVIAGTAYSCSEVVAMEWLVQEVLNFQCLLPTIYNFLWFYLKAARATKYMERTAKYLAVLALQGHEHLCYRPSTVASALVILSSSAENLYDSCHLVTETHARVKDEDLPDCIKSLEWLVKYI
ncbi:cyclin-sds [Nicotiana attenuata]|uniref:Cyclin-sds n=2 Tax=Nicotiana attenuata TaxID=49451 RepID=A0A1J6I1E4_NICAT|nr:cyclin-sds [Nicotiana attenuata]